MTSEHDSATAEATSLRGFGEVCEGSPSQPLCVNTEALRVPAVVVGDSMSGKDDACECGRPVGTRRAARRGQQESEPPYELRSGVMPMEQRAVGK